MAKTNSGKPVISPIERCRDTIRQFAIDAILNPFDALVRPLKTVAKVGGVGVGATMMTIGGPDILQSAADRAEISIEIPGVAGEAYAVECDGPFTIVDGGFVIIPGNCGVPPEDNGGGGGGGGGDVTPSKTWEQKTVELCAEIPNLTVEADTIMSLKGTDGSGRLATYVRECAISFVGEYVPELGRPMTNVEWAVLDASNNITPNPAQAEQLNIYIGGLVPAWLEANPQFAPTTVPVTTTTLPSIVETPSTIVPLEEEPASSATTLPAQVFPEDTASGTTTIVVTGDTASESSADTVADEEVAVTPGGGESSGGIGAVEILIGSLIVAGVAGGGLFFVRTRRQHALSAVASH